MKVGLGQYRSVLVGYVGPLWRLALLLLAFLLAGVGLQLVSPYLLSQFIDAVSRRGSYAVLVRLAVLFIVLTIGIQLLSVAEAYVAENLGLRATNELRADLTDHVLGLDMVFHNGQTPGALIERIDGDVGRLKNFFSRFAVDLLGNGLLMLGVLVALVWIDLRVGAALAVFTVLTFVVVYGLRDVAVPHFRASREADAELFGFLEERLAGTEDVRSSGATAYVMRRFFEQARKVLHTQLKASLIGVSTFSLSAVLFSLGSITALGGGAVLFQRGEITIGTVFLIFRYTQLLTGPIEVIGRQVQDLQQAGASILRISDLLNTKARLEEAGNRTLPEGAPAVSFQNVSFRYPVSDDQDEADWVLQDVSFTLQPGTKLGLLGRTGSGKTTLTRLLLRLYDPTEGAVYLGGVPLPQLRAESVYKGVAMVTQEIQLFHATVRENLSLFNPEVDDARMREALHEVGLGSWYQSLPEGLDSRLAPGGSDLSAGQAQLLAFVRVFLQDPGLVILDEASSRLDPATEWQLGHAIDRLLEGRTAIIIAHRLATVQRVDEIMILGGGRCLEFGNRQVLAANPSSHFASLLRTGLEETLA
jgi:ATP-binding cassette subfamily B protein